MKFSALALSAVSVLAVCALAACGDDSGSSPSPNSEPGLSSEGGEPGLSSESGDPGLSSEGGEPGFSSENGGPGFSSEGGAEPGSSAEQVSSSSAAASADTVWNQANLTWYTSWPDPGSDECLYYNGCTWAGYFAGVSGQMTEEWVSQHNIIAIHEKDWNTYKLKTFRLKKGGHTIDAVVYDKCADSDCDGCCTRNAQANGKNFLIDIESYTKQRFNNQGSGVVEWTCLDCE